MPLLHQWLLIVDDASFAASVAPVAAGAADATCCSSSASHPHPTHNAVASADDYVARRRERAAALCVLACAARHFPHVLAHRGLRGALRNIVVDLYEMYEDGAAACAPLSADGVIDLTASINELAQL